MSVTAALGKLADLAEAQGGLVTDASGAGAVRGAAGICPDWLPGADWSGPHMGSTEWRGHPETDW